MKYRVIKSNRKTIAIHIKSDGAVIVRAPKGMKDSKIDDFVISKDLWIKKHVKQIKEQRGSGEDSFQKLSADELKFLYEKSKLVIPDRVAYYAPKVGVTYGRITIRNQKTRWGSCSSKGNLNFNCLLMLTPPEVIDSVVVHELCHRKEMNHSQRFYHEIYKVFPEYDRWNDWLKKNGGRLMQRI